MPRFTEPRPIKRGRMSSLGRGLAGAILLGAFIVVLGRQTLADDKASTAPTAVAPAPRTGFALFTAKPIDPISDLYSGDPSPPLTLELAAPRNGSSSDMLVATDSKPIKGLSATVSDFHFTGGSAILPAKVFQVRYAEKEGGKNRIDNRFPDSGHGHFFYDDLVDVAPATNLTVPIWLTVNVPPMAAPGEYTGTMTVSVPNGKPVAVPAKLFVSAWTCPEPKDYGSYIGLIESPESVALKYKVPLWSDRHFELIEGVFKYLGLIGNKELTVTAIEGTQLGNYQSMIRMIKGEGPGKVDFTLFDRYLDLYAKHNAPPTALLIDLWEGSYDKGRDGKYRPFSASEVDSSTGAVTSKSMTYEAPEAKAYIQAVMDGVRERVKKRGWKEDCIMYAMASDGVPSDQTLSLLKDIAPYARWVKHSHGPAKEIGGVEVAVQAIVNGGAFFKGPGWANPRLELLFLRKKREREAGPATWRYIMEYSIFRVSCRGMGRIGADFWHVTVPGGNGEREMDNGHGAGYTGNLMINCSSCAMLAPGATGPVATARFEMLREDLQDCEALALLGRAMQTPDLKNKLSADLVTRCQNIMKRKDKVCGPNFGRSSGDMIDPPIDTPWIELRRTLSDLADEVTKATKTP